MDIAVLGTLSLALGIGLLIGLQRERAGSAIGGIRTFPLIALLGAISGLLAWNGAASSSPPVSSASCRSACS